MNNSPLDQDPTHPVRPAKARTKTPTEPSSNNPTNEPPKVHWRKPSRTIRSEALKKGRKQPLPAFTYN